MSGPVEKKPLFTEPIPGWKTYVVAALTFAYGWVGLYLKAHDVDAAVGYTLAAAAMVGIRLGINKSELK